LHLNLYISCCFVILQKLTLLDSGSRWQMPELLQAIVLMCHFHSVALFCQGAGINLEIDHQVEDYFNVLDTRKYSQNRSASPSTSGVAHDSGNGANVSCLVFLVCSVHL